MENRTADFGRYEFNKIRFGFAEAEVESARDPELLTKGFLDPNGVIDRLLSGSEFLVLGYKGSGKSAIAEHLRLRAELEPLMFVSIATVSDFPFNEFNEIVGGNEEPQSRLPSAWSWLLLIKLFGLLAKDEGALGSKSGEFPAAISVLKNLGLLPTTDLKKIAKVSSKKAFKLQIPMVVEGLIEFDREDADARIPLFAEKLQNIVSHFESESMHYLVIDGLDDILTQKDIQYDALAALVLEVSRLNLRFERNRTPAKIILLCRTDLFERIPGANKNKVRQDSAISLNWYQDTRNNRKSNLEELSLKRARLVYPKLRNLIGSFMPNEIHQKPTATFLFDLTRHTPRDFLRLLFNIQKFSTTDRLTLAQILSGTREYSQQYFLPEIKDELVGYVEYEQVQGVFDLIGSLRKREFSFAELEANLDESIFEDSKDLTTALHALFECSAIGNIQNRRTGTTFYTFKYRNPHSVMNIRDRFILHKGLWKAMNLV